MSYKKYTIHLSAVILVATFLTLSGFFYFTTPDQLISIIGINNAYSMIFVMAFIGGITTFAGVPYHLVLITLAAGGMNPLLLGLSTSAGVMLGDSTSYFVGYKGREIMPTKLHDLLQKLITYFMRYPKVLPIFFLVYASIIPLSNDFIVISMGLARYPFWKVMIPLAIGNVIFNVMLAYVAVYGYGYLQAFL